MTGKISRFVLALFVGGVCAGLMLITVPKIYAMAQIKGWIPGGVATHVVITSKWHQSADEARDGKEAFFIAWNRADIHVPGAHRTNVFGDQWSRMQVGDSIEIVNVPGDADSYLRDDIYVSPGNFVVDFVFLLFEVIGIAFVFRVARTLIGDLIGLRRSRA